jgi:hypothetical protein
MKTPTPSARLSGFLAKYSREVSGTAREALRILRARLPGSVQLVYDNYNALAIGFSPTERASDAVISIALYPRWVSLFFLQAKGLPDPHRLLKGNGRKVRHIVLAGADDLERPEIQALLAAALARAAVPFDPAARKRLVIKSVSANQRPRKPA